MKIVSIYESGKRRKIVHVVTQDDEDIWVDGEFAARHSLREGMEIEDGIWDAWLTEWRRGRAMDAALRYLGYRSRSRAEMEGHLQDKGYAPDAIAYVLDKLAGYGYLDDGRYAAEYLAGCRGARPKGRLRIRAELAQRGVPGDLIEEALQTYDEEEELEQAVACLRKLMALRRGKSPEIRRRQCYGALARRGFDWDTIQKAWSCIENETEDGT